MEVWTAGAALPHFKGSGDREAAPFQHRQHFPSRACVCLCARACARCYICAYPQGMKTHHAVVHHKARAFCYIGAKDKSAHTLRTDTEHFFFFSFLVVLIRVIWAKVRHRPMIGEHLSTLAVGRELAFAFKEAPNWHCGTCILVWVVHMEIWVGLISFHQATH